MSRDILFRDKEMAQSDRARRPTASSSELSCPSRLRSPRAQAGMLDTSP